VGTYDTLNVEGCEGAQVKCFGCGMAQLKVGDDVLNVTGDPTCRIYAIALREGGYLVIINNRIAHWRESEPEGYPIFDKWSDPYGEESVGIMDEPYFLDEAEDEDDGGGGVPAKLR